MYINSWKVSKDWLTAVCTVSMPRTPELTCQNWDCQAPTLRYVHHFHNLPPTPHSLESDQ